MAKRRRVALLIESSRKVGRDILGGIASYTTQFGPWLFCHYERSLDDPPPEWLGEWKPEGIISRIERRDVLRRVVRLGVPTVDLIYSRLPPVKGTIRVVLDQRAIVTAAADHLMAQGFTQFAFCGYPGILWSDVRQVQFTDYLAHARHTVFDYKTSTLRRRALESTAELDELRHTGELVHWVRSLPRPIGMMTCNDVRARQVISACDEAGIRVPDEVGVIGVDNDDLVCTFCDPPLTSVDQDVSHVGYRAAALLDRLMRGDPCPPNTVLSHPASVVSRGSTDAVFTTDPELRKLVRYIHEHACEGLTLNDLVLHTSQSRSTLQRWFARQLHRSPSEEIDRAKLARIKELLTRTNLAMNEIARVTGFEHFETMHRFFKAKVGTTPSAYRRGARTDKRAKNRGLPRPYVVARGGK